MAIQKQSYQITGMKQDNLVGTGFSTKFAHEIKNLRVNTTGDYTTTSWTTEKSTKKLSIEKLYNDRPWFGDEGFIYSLDDMIPVGQATINDTWVLFGILDKFDYILKFKYVEDVLCGCILYKGHLNFDYKHPLETLGYYENEQIQKVYWTDGLNQPRVINIEQDYTFGIDTQFDFVQEVSLNEEVEIDKLQLGNGIFPPCSVKYAISYYKKYGAETNLVYVSPLYYPTLGDRACSPDEISGDSFRIRVDNVDKDHGFDYIRLYSIIRTSDGATPIVRIVEDRLLSDDNFVEFIDTNTKGEVVDPTIIQYIGGDIITADTLDQKDNTLFLGNISLKQSTLASKNISINSDNLVFKNDNKKIIPYRKMLNLNTIREGSNIPIAISNDLLTGSYYSYHNEMNPAMVPVNGSLFKYHGNSNDIKTFKTGEVYRFGLQAQNNNGIWSDVIYIDDKEFDIKPINENGYYNVGYAKFTLPYTEVNKLFGNYKKLRLVCCYPSIGERKFLAQGIVNPTVSNNKYEDDHTPDRMASWFFRTNADVSFGKEVYSHSEPTTILGNPVFTGENDSLYSLKSDILTLNSPDIEFDESIRTLDTHGMSVMITATASINKFVNSAYVDAGSPAPNSIGVTNSGLSNNILKGNTSNIDNHYRSPFAIWNDCNVFYWDDGNSKIQYPIYPFHRKSSLNNYIKDLNDWEVHDDPHSSGTTEITVTQHAKLNSKALGYLHYSNVTEYNNTNTTIAGSNNSYGWFDSTEVTPVILNGKIYYGNMNTISPVYKLPSDFDTLKRYSTKIDDAGHLFSSTGSYLIKRIGYIYPTTGTYSLSTDWEMGHISYYLFTSDPVPITYKSTPHLVFTASGFNRGEYVDSQYVKIAELRKDGQERNTPQSYDIYIPCGPAVRLEENQDCVLYGFEGDCYLMRYDCMKTYPYATEDVNQIVEIASIMCETRVNIDGRYDRNRGLMDNTTVTPANFNLINKSYTQSDNLFSYTTIDKDEVNLDNFNNQFTWTKTKVSGEDVDAWTNLTLASVADADGVLGSITKILNLNDSLYLFQEHGIAQIGYNEKTAISTENGVPLEIANSGKFTGLRYLTTHIGCQNKWSISNTKNGIFFIDDSRQEIISLGEGFTGLSTSNGFDALMIQQLPKLFKKWNPVDFENFVTYYDKLSNDIYYINKDTCLAWNEQTGTFTSFYDYNGSQYIVNLNTHSLIFNNGIHAMREGDNYSSFFGTLKPYWITLVCDGQTNDGNAFPADKVFNNIEYRADCFNPDGVNSIINEPLFNKKAAWNGYQMYKEFDIDAVRKFNIWRVQLPRATYNIDGTLTTTRDRIRNPFCYIKLLNDNNDIYNRMILHDLAVYFDIN